MEFIGKHWGDLLSGAGFILASIGLAWAAIQSGRAQSSAEAAKDAANSARNAIGQHLLIVDMERAINLIERLKLLHRNESWEAALENYQTLRATLSAIAMRFPKSNIDPVEIHSKTKESISGIELEIDSWKASQSEGIDVVRINQSLNDIQSSLEDMSSSMELGG